MSTSLDLDAIRDCRDRQDGVVRRDLLGVCSEHDWYWPEGRLRCNFFTDLEVAAVAEVEQLRATIIRVEAIHAPIRYETSTETYCEACNAELWPCPTIRAMVDQERQP